LHWISSPLRLQLIRVRRYGYNDSFKADYPHKVKLVSERTGVQSVDIDEMVNFCVTVSMQGEPLKWNSNDLLALSAEVRARQQAFKAGREPSMKNN